MLLVTEYIAQPRPVPVTVTPVDCFGDGVANAEVRIAVCRLIENTPRDAKPASVLVVTA